MSEDRYGDLDPGNPILEERIFCRAMKEFLWPQDGIITADRARIVASCTFTLWCSWWQRVICGSLDVKPPSPVLRYIVEGIENRGADSLAEGESLGDLCRLWRQAWSGMLEGESVTPLPGKKAAKRGMKFCLIALVLRYGLESGRVKKAGKRTLPDGREVDRIIDSGLSMQEASESASLLLAVSALSHKQEIKSVSNVPWAKVEILAAIMRSPAGKRAVAKMETKIDGLKDFERNGIGLAGFRKLLRTMPPVEWSKVSPLAAEYQSKAGSNFDEWMKGERLECWFPFEDG